MDTTETTQTMLNSTAMEVEQSTLSSLPHHYVLSASKRPHPNLTTSASIPTVDLSSLFDSSLRDQTIEDIRTACQQIGFFRVINHGVDKEQMQDALEAAMEFFNLPNEEKMHLFSSDVHEPVRYGTSLNQAQDKVFFWRNFIKHYSHPISKWIHLWPSNPTNYRKKMGDFAKEVHRLHKLLMKLVLESLELNPNYLEGEIEEGCQTLAVNYYPVCPEPDLTLGIPPHSDYGSITVLHQNREGLQIKDQNNEWIPVPADQDGALLVLLGDQIEVLSNGKYKGVLHRATVNAEDMRVSIASLHSFAMEKKVEAADELVNEELQQPKLYEGFSFKDFLDFISRNDITQGRFIDTLKKN